MIEVKEAIVKYIKIKPKYFNRNEINDIINTFKKSNDYINNLEIQNKKCKCSSLEKEILNLRHKLKNIKINLENIEIGKDKYEDSKERDINMNDIFLFFKKTQKDGNVIFKVLIYFIYIFIYYIYCLYIYIDNYINNKK